jgi:hypothetical protein
LNEDIFEVLPTTLERCTSYKELKRHFSQSVFALIDIVPPSFDGKG